MSNSIYRPANIIDKEQIDPHGKLSEQSEQILKNKLDDLQTDEEHYMLACYAKAYLDSQRGKNKKKASPVEKKVRDVCGKVVDRRTATVTAWQNSSIASITKVKKESKKSPVKVKEAEAKLEAAKAKKKEGVDTPYGGDSNDEGDEDEDADSQAEGEEEYGGDGEGDEEVE